MSPAREPVFEALDRFVLCLFDLWVYLELHAFLFLDSAMNLESLIST
jgi:hypothetical protein